LIGKDGFDEVLGGYETAPSAAVFARTVQQVAIAVRSLVVSAEHEVGPVFFQPVFCTATGTCAGFIKDIVCGALYRKQRLHAMFVARPVYVGKVVEQANTVHTAVV